MNHDIHPDHLHRHDDACGHLRVRHEDHVDYLHDGHLHSLHDNHVDEHTLPAGAEAASCDGAHACGGHAGDHRHGDACGHEAIPHGEHVDHLVDGHLHHAHESHCDDHGAVTLA